MKSADLLLLGKMFLPRLTYLSALGGFLIFTLLGCQSGSRVAVVEDGGDRGSVGVLDEGDVLGAYTDTVVYRGYGPTTSNRVKTPVKYEYGTVIDARPAATYAAARSTERDSRSAAAASIESSAQSDANRGAEGVRGHHRSRSVRADFRSSNLSSRGGQSAPEWRTSEVETNYSRGDRGVDSHQKTQDVDSRLDSAEIRPTLAARSSGSALRSFIIQPLSGPSISQDRAGRTDVRQRAKSEALDSDSKTGRTEARNLSRSLAGRSGTRGADLSLGSTTLLSRKRIRGTEPISLRRKLANIFEDYALGRERKSADVASSSATLGARDDSHDAHAQSYSSRKSLDHTSGEKTTLVVKRKRGHGRKIASRTIEISSGLSVSAETHRLSQLDRSYHITATSQMSVEGSLENLSQRRDTQARHAATRHGTSYRIDATNAASRAARPDIKLTKSVDKESAAPGDVLTFTISYENVGDGPASNITISDSLSQGLIYIPGSASGKGAKATVHTTRGGATEITWAIKKVIAPGERGFVRFKARVR